MIVRQPCWYHHLMLSFGAQVIITLAALVIIGAQILFYNIIDNDIVVFNGKCAVKIGPTYVNDDGKEITIRGARMMCGDESRSLGNLEAPYLYEVLTNKREPVIVCVKTVGEYNPNKKHWDCEMDPKEQKEQT